MIYLQGKVVGTRDDRSLQSTTTEQLRTTTTRITPNGGKFETLNQRERGFKKRKNANESSSPLI